jgi:type IV pilus assembly protein PilQ
VATVEFREAGIILTVTPQVTNNRQILMSLSAERSGIAEAGADIGIVIDKQQATSRVLVADGETAVIGGLTVTQVNVSKSGIPLLVDLPLIGRLFGRTITRELKQDLLVLLTPHIVEYQDATGSPPGR